MKGHFQTGLAVLGALLLTLPLMGLFALTRVKTIPEASHVQEPVVIPMLHPVEREGTLTYGRECQDNSECDPRLRCFFSMVTQTSYCVDSRCMTDRDCPEGLACQTYETDAGRALIKACSRVGVRKEGEGCELFTREPGSGCEQGLVCQWTCGRPCTPGGSTTCPAGFFCNALPTGAACQPTCEGRTCPGGQQCIDLGGQVSVCAKVHGTNCQATACGPGQDCSARTYPWAPGEVWMQCSQTCGLEESPPCPDDTTCATYRCRSVCSSDQESSCAEGYECQSRPGQPSICAPSALIHRLP